jgi:hypothetical protein
LLLYRDMDWHLWVERTYEEVCFVARYGNQDIEKVERWPRRKRQLVMRGLTKLIKIEYKD